LDAAEQEVRELGASEQRSAAAAERLRALRAISERLSAEQLQREAEIEAARRRQQTRGDRLRELEARLGEATTSVAGLDAARRTEGAAEQALADARGAQVRLDTRLDGLVERVALAERGRADRAHLVEEASDLEAKADWVAEPFRFAVLRMEKELLAHAQTAFERAFARFFASLIDDPTLVARTDVSFTPEVTIAGQPTPSEALSGGERTSLALAFRLALASVVRSLGAVRLQTLLLDEPTEGFSAEQVVRMGELLEELALPQVVLVSHESELTGIADRTVRVLKVGGRSVLDAGGSEAAQSAGDAVAGGGPPTEPPASPAPPGRP
jgi:exonuclease SbcC